MSLKNGTTISVHNSLARRFAIILENDDTIRSYKTNIPLLELSKWIDKTGIRPAYMDTEWTSDFMIEYNDGMCEVVEVEDAESLEKKATVEKLEISRRYWKANNINSWKIVIYEKGDTAW